jgi:hypothetical protein
MPETTEPGNLLPTVASQQFSAIDIRSSPDRHFPPRRIAGFRSEVLVLGVYDGDGTVVLLRADRPVGPGQRVG